MSARVLSCDEFARVAALIRNGDWPWNQECDHHSQGLSLVATIEAKDRIIATLVERMVKDMHDEYDGMDADANAEREARYRAEIAALIAGVSNAT